MTTTSNGAPACYTRLVIAAPGTCMLHSSRKRLPICTSEGTSVPGYFAGRCRANKHSPKRIVLTRVLSRLQKCWKVSAKTNRKYSTEHNRPKSTQNCNKQGSDTVCAASQAAAHLAQLRKRYQSLVHCSFAQFSNAPPPLHHCAKLTGYDFAIRFPKGVIIKTRRECKTIAYGRTFEQANSKVTSLKTAP